MLHCTVLPSNLLKILDFKVETTRAEYDVMKLRDDVFEGKAISVEPHLKLKTAKGEPDHQRLHFCYDPEGKKIIIGYLGDHLDSAATQYVK